MLESTGYAKALSSESPGTLEEIRGIAEGANVPLETIFAFNLRDEQETYLRELGKWLETGPGPGGCTSVGVITSPTRSAIGQNIDVSSPWNWVGGEVLLDVTGPDQPRAIIVSEAGSVGFCGCNEAGIGVCCNTLAPLVCSTKGLPVSGVVREVLAQAHFLNVTKRVSAIPHATGQNYLLGSAEELLDLECSSRSVVKNRQCDNLRLWHTNHPLANPDVDPSFPGEVPGYLESSVGRERFACTAVVDATSGADLRRLLADRSVPVSQTGEDDPEILTYCSIVMELGASTSAWVAFGPPDRTAYEQVTLGTAR
jgi:hypothetical protein